MSEQITPYQVTPKTPLAGSAAADIREQGEITRRSFPLALTTAWLGLTAAASAPQAVTSATGKLRRVISPCSRMSAAALPASGVFGAT